MAGPEKVYHPAEEVMNVATHISGLAVMLSCGGVLLAKCTSGIAWWAVLIYVVSLGCVYASSGAYHWAKEKKLRAFLRTCDHAAIYLLIAGTYTPLMLLAVGGKAGITVMCINWGLALAGIVCEIAAYKPFRGFTILLYITMGWLCIAVAGRMIAAMEAVELLFLLAGGIAYTAGVIFYLARWKYAHALWHVFVLAGSLLQFVTVWMIAAK